MKTRFATMDSGLLVLRLGYAACLIGFHGWTRFFRALDLVVHGTPWPFVNLVARLGFPYPATFAVLSALAESVAALMVAAGFYTRVAAAVIAFNMGVAFYNEATQWSTGGTPELPALYLIVAVAIAILGAGAFAIDGRRSLQGRAPALRQ
ncbi:MAG: DoxX family protein [Vicinamibacterales bacterium]